MAWVQYAVGPTSESARNTLPGGSKNALFFTNRPLDWQVMRVHSPRTDGIESSQLRVTRRRCREIGRGNFATDTTHFNEITCEKFCSAAHRQIFRSRLFERLPSRPAAWPCTAICTYYQLSFPSSARAWQRERRKCLNYERSRIAAHPRAHATS